MKELLRKDYNYEKIFLKILSKFEILKFNFLNKIKIQ